jgi:hypothetical protein
MLVVNNVSEPRAPHVEFDDYIPLQIDWVEPGSVRPVYYRAVGSDGGDIEIKFEPLTGLLVGIVVNEFPSLCSEGIRDCLTPTEDGQAHFDLASWSLNADGVPTEVVVRDHVAMCMESGGDGVKLRMRDQPVQRWIGVGDVSVGTNADDELVCLRLPVPTR